MKTVLIALTLLALDAGAQIVGNGTNIAVIVAGKSFAPQVTWGRSFKITPAAPTALQSDGTHIIAGQSLTIPATSGQVVTNLWTGKYTIAVQGIAQTFSALVTTNFGPGPVPLVWFCTNLVMWTGSGSPIPNNAITIDGMTNNTILLWDQ